MAGGLRRDLGLAEATSIVVGSMIGSGIFLGVQEMARLLRDPWLVLAVFLASGALVLLGALTYGELAALFPTSGGTYVYIKEAYGPIWGYLQGWSLLTIAKSASLAALGVGFATYLGAIPPFDALAANLAAQKAVAVALIVGLSFVNVLGVRHGGRIATVSVVAKVGAIAALVIFGLMLFGGATRTGLPEPPPAGWDLLTAFGLAMVPAMFAYDGWTNSTQVGDEIKNPERTIPRSLVLGILLVAAVYLAAAFTYLLHLGVGGVAATEFAAAETARSFGGDTARTLLVLGVLVSIAGTANAVIVSGPRITYAMARDGLFWRWFADVDAKHGTPARTIWLQAAWSSALALFFDFGALLDTVIFASWVWYGLAAAAIFVFRRRRPDAPRPVRAPLYPWIPVAFCAATVVFSLNTLVGQPRESLLGIAIVSAGLIPYGFFRERWERERDAPHALTPDAPGGPGASLDAAALRVRVLDLARRRHARGESWNTDDVAREIGADPTAVYHALTSLSGTDLDLAFVEGRLVVRPRA